MYIFINRTMKNISLEVIVLLLLFIVLPIESEKSRRRNSTTSNDTRAANATSIGCNINLPTDIPENEPVYLKIQNGKYSFFKPENESNIFLVNSKLTLFCPGKDNLIENINRNRTELTCRDLQGFHFENELAHRTNIAEHNCTKLVRGEIRVSREKCAKNQGNIVEIGFKVNLRDFVEVFKICLNNITDKTFYSTHIINGAAIKYSIKENKRPSFQKTGLTGLKNIGTLYNKQSQIHQFNELLGSSQNAVNDSVYLARGHLTPDADFVFATQQFATYFYINVAPEYQSINGGNWKRVENMFRDLASDYQTDFQIFTGTYDILSLPNQFYQNTPVYLDKNNRIPIPKWFWKVIKNTKLDSAIVMITLNNPNARRSDIVEFCANVCQQASLTSRHFLNIKKGYTFCCDIDSFKRFVDFLPSNLTATSLLTCSRINGTYLN